jgi:methionyl-tRNA formyltransferase
MICIGTFPRRIPQEITKLAALGAIKVHPSLLPRHRGPLPLFWTHHVRRRCQILTFFELRSSAT